MCNKKISLNKKRGSIYNRHLKIIKKNKGAHCQKTMIIWWCWLIIILYKVEDLGIKIMVDFCVCFFCLWDHFYFTWTLWILFGEYCAPSFYWCILAHQCIWRIHQTRVNFKTKSIKMQKKSMLIICLTMVIQYPLFRCRYDS